MKTGIIQKIIDYFKEVKVEIKKVNWPSRQETIRYTLIVIVVSMIVAGFLGGLDLGFKALINKFLLGRFSL